MNKRLDLHYILTNILGSSSVYFQPPENLKLNYPCIVYSFDGFSTKHADNKKYIDRERYSVTVIEKSPEGKFIAPFRELEYCEFDRSFISDGLHHYVFTIYL